MKNLQSTINDRVAQLRLLSPESPILVQVNPKDNTAALSCPVSPAGVLIQASESVLEGEAKITPQGRIKLIRVDY